MTEANTLQTAGSLDDDTGVVVALDPTAATGAGHQPEQVPGRLLVVVAHPDDVDFGAAGTIATWTAAGCKAAYCIVTDGAAGSSDPSVDLASLAARRQEEQRAAAAVVGVGELYFLGFPDGQLEPTQAVRREVSRVIRATRPDIVLTQSPERDFLRIRASHPDHLAAGEATLRAVYPDARNPYAHPELLKAGLAPYTVPEVWLMASPRPTLPVDITDAFDRKVAALREHKSQIEEPDAIAGLVGEWARITAELHGLQAGRLAEAFQVVDTR